MSCLRPQLCYPNLISLDPIQEAHRPPPPQHGFSCFRMKSKLLPSKPLISVNLPQTISVGLQPSWPLSVLHPGGASLCRCLL